MFRLRFIFGLLLVLVPAHPGLRGQDQEEDILLFSSAIDTVQAYLSPGAVVLDFSGRPFLVYNVPLPKAQVGNFELELVEEFFTAFCNHAGANVHINLAYGDNLHHIVEAVFKAFARALDEATQLDPRVEGVLSSKGTLE